MDDRALHPYDELHVDKFPFDEDGHENIHATVVLKTKTSNVILSSNTNVRKRQQQQQVDRPNVYFQTEESMKALYMAKKSSYATASFLYPGDSAVHVATMDAATNPSRQLFFLQTPTHEEHATCDVYAQPPHVSKQAGIGSDAPRVPPQPSAAASVATEIHTSPSLPPITSLLHELTTDWKQYFNGDAVTSQVVPSAPNLTSDKEAETCGDNNSFVPPKSNPPSTTPEGLETPALSPVWRRYLDFSRLSSTCQGVQPDDRDIPWCADDTCTVQSVEAKSQSKHQQFVDFLSVDGPPHQMITAKPELPKIIVVTPSTFRSPPPPPPPPPPRSSSVHHPQIVTTQETLLTTRNTVTTTVTTTVMTTSTTQTTTNDASTKHTSTSWTSPPDLESQSPPWSCPYGRPARSISTTPSPRTTTSTGHGRRDSSSCPPQRLDWSHRLDVPLIDAVAAAASANNTTTNESYSSNAAAATLAMTIGTPR